MEELNQFPLTSCIRFNIFIFDTFRQFLLLELELMMQYWNGEINYSTDMENRDTIQMELMC